MSTHSPRWSNSDADRRRSRAGGFVSSLLLLALPVPGLATRFLLSQRGQFAVAVAEDTYRNVQLTRRLFALEKERAEISSGLFKKLELPVPELSVPAVPTSAGEKDAGKRSPATKPVNWDEEQKKAEQADERIRRQIDQTLDELKQPFAAEKLILGSPDSPPDLKQKVRDEIARRTAYVEREKAKSVAEDFGPIIKQAKEIRRMSEEFEN